MHILSKILLGVGVVSITSCGGGSSPEDAGVDATASVDCTGSCVTAGSLLAISDVETIMAQAVSEAQARGLLATIAVVDRVGNVLGVFQMTGAPSLMTISTGTGATGGLEGIELVPASLGAIAKAVTGAYLSSEGNAFSTRTASQIIQEHFNPGEEQKPAGPLFGVQFSQLACSDFSSAFISGGGAAAGPKRSPLGLSGDPGGFPLYRGGTVVGGVGIMASSASDSPVYSIDRDVTNIDQDAEEAIALAATFGFGAPTARRADRITAGGKTFRFSDTTTDDLQANPSQASFSAVNGVAGNVVSVGGYSDGALIAGTAFGQPASGIRVDTESFSDLDAFVFVDGANSNRYPPIAGSALTSTEVTNIIRSALSVANRARAQIRAPLDSQARVTISVVDTDGEVLAMARTRDAPVFGADVSLQKARSATFLSSADAATVLASLPDAKYLDSDTATSSAGADFGDYVSALQTFLADDTALETGSIAFSSRGAGNIALPLFPDGIDGRGEGPFSKSAGNFSAFNIGLQLDVSYNGIVNHLAFLLGIAGTDVDASCLGRKSVLDTDAGVTARALDKRLANGLQLFPGGVPIYRGNTLVGGIGVSGDGVDQDDMIAFLGVDGAAGDFSNAPAELRSDNLVPQGVRLRYVQCPQTPYVNSSAQNVCSGK